MNNFLSRDPFNIQSTLSDFNGEFSIIKTQNSRDTLINIIKKITLLKIIYSHHPNNRFLISSIFDFLSCISNIILSEKRYFYFNLRSSIENTIRFSLGKGNTDTTGVNELFKEFNNSNFEKKMYTDLKNKYSTSCDFVHNNINADLDVSRSYIKIKSSEQLNESDIYTLAKELSLIVEIIINIVLQTNKGFIDDTFKYSHDSLRLLIGEKKYKIFYP